MGSDSSTRHTASELYSMKLRYRSALVRNSWYALRFSSSTTVSRKLIATRVARYSWAAPTRTKGFESPAKGPRPRLAKYETKMAVAAASIDDHRGGMRKAAITTNPSMTNGISRMVVTPPGGAENTQLVMASIPKPMNIISTAGPAGAECRRARQRTAQLITIGAMHSDPSQFPAHHSCHSRR